MTCGECECFRHWGDGFGVCALFTLDGYDEDYCPPALWQATCVVPGRLAAVEYADTAADVPTDGLAGPSWAPPYAAVSTGPRSSGHS